MYKFEWYYGISNQKSFESLINTLKKDQNPVCNYEQAARLFYDDEKGNTVMIELQVPTYAMFEFEENIIPWLDAYEIENFENYDAENEIYSMWSDEVITFDNAEKLMLNLAKEVVNNE